MNARKPNVSPNWLDEIKIEKEEEPKETLLEEVLANKPAKRPAKPSEPEIPPGYRLLPAKERLFGVNQDFIKGYYNSFSRFPLFYEDVQPNGLTGRREFCLDIKFLGQVEWIVLEELVGVGCGHKRSVRMKSKGQILVKE